MPTVNSPVKTRLQLTCAGLAVAAALCLAAAPARAETTASLEASINGALDDAESRPGWGLDLAVGPRLDLALINLTAELSAGRHGFGGPRDVSLCRGMVGARLAVGAIIQPSVFAHVGVGHLREADPDSDGRRGRTNLAGDAGLALDFTLLPLVNLGIQGSYNTIVGSSDAPAFPWLQGGAHITFVF